MLTTVNGDISLEKEVSIVKNSKQLQAHSLPTGLLFAV